MNKTTFGAIPALIAVTVASGCLQTRADIENKKKINDQLVTLQQERARGEVRLQSYDEQFRQLHGRIEELERKLEEVLRAKEEATQKKQVGQTQMGERLKIYEEALRQMGGQVQAFHKELATLRTVKKKKGGNFANAEEAYKKKSWKSAIVGYQKYRELNPKGRRYSTATLKIGRCFEELGMASDAKAFFEEVIEKFPKSKNAKMAQKRLKSIK